MSNNLVSVWHQGELTIQDMVGTTERMAELGPKFIREYMPIEHREFFQSLSMLFIGYTDNFSHINASVLMVILTLLNLLVKQN